MLYFVEHETSRGKQVLCLSPSFHAHPKKKNTDIYQFFVTLSMNHNESMNQCSKVRGKDNNRANSNQIVSCTIAAMQNAKAP